MGTVFKVKVQIVIITIAVFALGTFGYYFIEEGWTLFESFYMTVITVTTVGYGETKPLSDAGRLFTIVLIFLGLGTAALFATQLAKTFLENNFKDIFGANKMKNNLGKLQDHFIVCGFGDIGSSICSVLDQAKIPFSIIEADEETANHAIRRRFLTVKGKATYDTSLFQAGIKRASGIVLCLGDDSLNMHVSLAARELNPDIFIISRGYKPDVEKRLIRAGANTVVNPLKLGGEQIAALLITQYKTEHTLEDSTVQNASVMGYALKMYQHFQPDPVPIEQVKDRLGALRALKIRKSDGSEIHYPPEDTEIANLETVLFLIDEDAAANDLQVESVTEPESVFFEWSDMYSVGVSEIDEEHQKLFDLSNQFIGAMNKGQGTAELTRTFDALIEYTCTHFNSEENFILARNYPDAEAHIEEHRKLTDKVLDLNKNKTYIFPDNVSGFLSSWLKDHILESDMRYAKYLRENDLLTKK